MVNKRILSEETAHTVIKKRILAAWIDIFLLLVPLSFRIDFLFIIIFLLNYIILPHFKGYTVGMYLMRIRIIDTFNLKQTKISMLRLLLRALYFFTIYPWENIPTRGIVRINEMGQTKLDERFGTTIVFKDTLWNDNVKPHIYESYLHHVIFFSIVFLYAIFVIIIQLFEKFIR